MISVEKAIEESKEFAEKVLGTRVFKGLFVEEVELSKNEKFWLITLGWDEPVKGLNSTLQGIVSPERVYKVFYVDAETGTVNKMKFLE